MKISIIGGDWDDMGGRRSGYVDRLFKALHDLQEYAPGGYTKRIVDFNGGRFDLLERMVSEDTVGHLKRVDVIIWLANVPNDKPKLVRMIKEINPKAILVTSKNNIDKKYSHMDLIARALQTKSNLLLEFTKEDGNICGNLIDPLGNCWCHTTDDVNQIASSLHARLKELVNFTRIGSQQVGDALEVPNERIFFNFVRDLGDEFHTLIHGANTSRFLGNASFRCEKGFPSMKRGDTVYVSRRNIDKRELSTDGFVACNAYSLEKDSKVLYYGDKKPSVDTPIQLCLYSYYKNIRYMVHSHVYVEDAPFTKRKVPCGALEEVDEITSTLPWSELKSFAINLKGHGSIIAAASYDLLWKYKFVARPTPEY